MEPHKLSREQVRVIEGTFRRREPLALSAISLLEIAVLASESRNRFGATLDEIFDELQVEPGFLVLPLTYEIAFEVAALASLRDPADCAIVATARVHRCAW
jgi:PIN domain nuclease of toxin-antitoxin system